MKHKHIKTRGNTNLWYTDNWHLYVFCKRPTKRGNISAGVTVKHRLDKDRVNHYGAVYLRYPSRERGGGEVRFFELSRHRSNRFFKGRLMGSKRYIRVKVCY